MTKISNQYSLTNILTADLANSRLGINNVSPAYSLDVTGTARVSGSVGIGNPSAIEGVLTIKGTSAQPPTSGTTANSLLQLVGSLGAELNIGSNTVAGGYGSYIQASDNNLAVPYPLNLQPNGGNVGIGTSTPNGPLSIQANTGNTAIRLIGTSNASSNNAGIYWYNSNDSTFNGYLGNFSTSFDIYNERSTPMIFSTAGTERMRITSGGDVLVGTTTASYTAVNRGNITIGGAASSLLAFQVGGTAKAYIYSDGTNWSLNNNASGAIYMLSTSGGVQLNSGATSWASSSDERLKNINSNIENAVDKLSSLRTVNFSWKSDETQKEVLGLIAQDVDKVFPQVVDKSKLPVDINGERTDETEYLNVRYTELVPVLVKAIQELSAKVSLLENK